jgi:hypothetical protein
MFKVSLILDLIDQTTIRCEVELAELPRQGDEVFVIQIPCKPFHQVNARVRAVRQILVWTSSDTQNHFLVWATMGKEIDMLV